jgi:hypothetical protein
MPRLCLSVKEGRPTTIKTRLGNLKIYVMERKSNGQFAVHFEGDPDLFVIEREGVEPRKNPFGPVEPPTP